MKYVLTFFLIQISLLAERLPERFWENEFPKILESLAIKVKDAHSIQYLDLEKQDIESEFEGLRRIEYIHHPKALIEESLEKELKKYFCREVVKRKPYLECHEPDYGLSIKDEKETEIMYLRVSLECKNIRINHDKVDIYVDVSEEDALEFFTSIHQKYKEVEQGGCEELLLAPLPAVPSLDIG